MAEINTGRWEDRVANWLSDKGRSSAIVLAEGRYYKILPFGVVGVGDVNADESAVLPCPELLLRAIKEFKPPTDDIARWLLEDHETDKACVKVGADVFVVGHGFFSKVSSRNSADLAGLRQVDPPEWLRDRILQFQSQYS
jgi:hypothetical protein